MLPKCYSYIRFSTPEQLKGDSLRRQTELSAKYAAEHGLDIDPMHDLGLSAFKGEHRTRGTALGRFLTLVTDGKIVKGSTLLVESLDRLSREQVADAYDQFRAIIKAGVRIITLGDGMEYTRESIDANIGQLMFSLMIMSRANDESATKSRRLKASWANKRENINQRKMTARAPAWLELSPDRTTFVAIPERAAIIKRIFQEKAAGKGSRLIASELNKQTAWLPDTQKRTNKLAGWRESYIQKILRSPAVIGEYQMHKLETNAEGRTSRHPTGDIIKNYFPAVVPEDLFYAVQLKLDQDRSRAGHGGGRNGVISNLFGHIAKCGYCGESIAFLNKGKSPKGGGYLVCDAARRGVSDCKRYYVRYDEFEKMILTYCKGLNPADLLPGYEESESALQVLKGRLYKVQTQRSAVVAKANNLADTIAASDNANVRKMLEGRLIQALEERDNIEAEAKQLKREIDRSSFAHVDSSARLKSIEELFHFLQNLKGEELIAVRRKLREELRSLIERIDVYPVGLLQMSEYHVNRMLSAALDVTPDLDAEKLQQMKKYLQSEIGNKELRQFNIFFKGGSIRSLKPRLVNNLAIDFDRENAIVMHQDADGNMIETR